MRISNYFLNELFAKAADAKYIDVVLYMIDNYNYSLEKNIFNARDFLKHSERVLTNTKNTTDFIKKLSFFSFEAINQTQTFYKMLPELQVYLETKDYGYCDFDISVAYKLKSMYSKKIYLYFQKERNFGTREYKLKNLIKVLRVSEYYKKTSEFLRLLRDSFEEINQITGDFEFGIIKKTEGRNISSLLFFFDSKDVGIYSSSENKKSENKKNQENEDKENNKNNQNSYDDFTEPADEKFIPENIPEIKKDFSEEDLKEAGLDNDFIKDLFELRQLTDDSEDVERQNKINQEQEKQKRLLEEKIKQAKEFDEKPFYEKLLIKIKAMTSDFGFEVLGIDKGITEIEVNSENKIIYINVGKEHEFLIDRIKDNHFDSRIRNIAYGLSGVQYFIKTQIKYKKSVKKAV